MSIKDDLKEAKEEIQELKGQSLAMELGVSESTITYQWKKIKKKILKVI